jgi:tetratricopeptide (TPR) repeat protein/predicted Ser/Thr protein kinase
MCARPENDVRTSNVRTSWWSHLMPFTLDIRSRSSFDRTMQSNGLEATAMLDVTNSPIEDTSRGALIGRYVVLSKLGAGGMGVVLAAYDPELDRKIALKLLKTVGHSSTRARLQREARALAKLDHRNVVAVHDVGVHEGQLFVAMEFVAGKTLGAWMNEVERPWTEVLRVFAEAGRGLVAAHEAGLVHRDFKPDNVMLGDDGRVRVMDFGLARAEIDESVGERLDLETSPEHAGGKQLLREPLTQTGTMLGTPGYMSPEQFKGTAADARSDQFGFCVSLYEALYGTRPFAGTSLPELRWAVTYGKVEPAPKGTSVPMWLRAIVVRGLTPEPEQRWPSMRALLDALANDPAARRRKWFAIAGVVGLLGGATWGTVWAVRADEQICSGFEERLAGVWDDGRRAEVQAAIEGTKLSYAPETWERVEQRLDEYTQQWVAAREQACQATHDGEQSGELLDLRMACLDERLQHVRATVDVLARADGTVLEKAVEAVSALPRLERCADVNALTASVSPPEDPEVAKRVAALDEQLVEALALQRAGKYPESMVLVDAVMPEAASLGYEPLLVRAWLRQAGVQEGMGNYELAEATLEKAYESALGQRMVIEAAKASTTLVSMVGYRLERYEDGRRWAKFANASVRAVGTDEALANYFSQLGKVPFSEGKYEEARGYWERALAIEERVYGPEDRRVAMSLMHLGNVANSDEEKRGYYERALAIGEKALGPEHPEVASILNNLGRATLSEGKYEEARGHLYRALGIQERAQGSENPQVACTLTNLGLLLLQQGKYEEARGYLERALTIYEKALGTERPCLLATLNNLGHVAYIEGRYDEALGHVEHALAIQEKALGPEHPDLAGPIGNLGSLAHALGKYEDARGYHERALAIQEKALGPEHQNVALALNNLGVVASSQGKDEDARGYYERALAIWEKALGPEHPLVAEPVDGLGLVAESHGKYEEAQGYFERSLAIYEKALGPEHPQLARTVTRLGNALLGQGKPTEALPHLERSLTILGANPGDPQWLTETHFVLARALWDAPAKAGRDRERARTLAELARKAYADAGEAKAEKLEEVKGWLAVHAGPH